MEHQSVGIASRAMDDLSPPLANPCIWQKPSFGVSLPSYCVECEGGGGSVQAVGSLKLTSVPMLVFLRRVSNGELGEVCGKIIIQRCAFNDFSLRS